MVKSLAQSCCLPDDHPTVARSFLLCAAMLVQGSAHLEFELPLSRAPYRHHADRQHLARFGGDRVPRNNIREGKTQRDFCFLQMKVVKAAPL